MGPIRISRVSLPFALPLVTHMCRLDFCRILCFSSLLDAGGIGWGHNMKFRMGLQMMDMVAWVYARLSDVKFPFLIMHDPEDGKNRYCKLFFRMLFFFFRFRRFDRRPLLYTGN